MPEPAPQQMDHLDGKFHFTGLVLPDLQLFIPRQPCEYPWFVCFERLLLAFRKLENWFEAVRHWQINGRG